MRTLFISARNSGLAQHTGARLLTLPLASAASGFPIDPDFSEAPEFIHIHPPSTTKDREGGVGHFRQQTMAKLKLKQRGGRTIGVATQGRVPPVLYTLSCHLPEFKLAALRPCESEFLFFPRW